MWGSGKLKEYRVKIAGVEHTLQLSERDAERYGAAAVEVKQAPAPENKARRAVENKAADS